LGGRSSWAQSLTIKNAINVEQGSIVKEAILKFQRRERDYPHRVSPPING
jgi:N5-(carboxyethyl)ornithine synthase